MLHGNGGNNPHLVCLGPFKVNGKLCVYIKTIAELHELSSWGKVYLSLSFDHWGHHSSLKRFLFYYKNDTFRIMLVFKKAQRLINVSHIRGSGFDAATL